MTSLPRKVFTKSNGWRCGLVAIVAVQIWFFTRTIDTPWTDHLDFNGATWSQAAHNFLKGGVIASAGVPAPFHFGPMPIPPEQYYGHHSGLLALVVTGVFKLFGEHEWAARLVPITCSTASVFLLWLIVKSGAGRGAATFSAAVFATLPMQLRWGQMVNFEPCALMWMLVGFLGFRYWELTGKKRWWNLMLLGWVMSLLTAWLGYILVGLLCLYFLIFDRKRYGRLALLLMGIAVALAGLFLIQNSTVRPDALSDLAKSFSMRFGQTVGSQSFTFHDWAIRIQGSLAKHIPLPFVLLALAGIVHLLRHRQESEKLRLGWICGCFGVMNLFYIVAFRNASYIHEYASFYFVVPVAILAGVGVQTVGCWVGKMGGKWRSQGLSDAASLALVFAVGIFGLSKTEALQSQAHILDLHRPEPRNLIPQLGKLIRLEFPPDTAILCNVDLYFTPQLWYYSQRKPISGLTKGAHWRNYLSNNHERHGGVIWLGAPEVADILALLGSGSQKVVMVEGIPFCIWKPGKRRN